MKIRAIVIGALLSIITAMPLSAQAFGRNKVQWEGLRIYKLQGEKTHVLYPNGALDLAQAALAEMEASYDTLASLSELEPREEPFMILYLPEHVTQSNIYPGFIPGNVAGFAEPLKMRIVIPFSGRYHFTKCVIRHEMVHRFQYEAYQRFRDENDFFFENGVWPPLWWTEGHAEHWSGNHDTCRGFDMSIYMRNLVIGGYMPSIQEISFQGGFAPYLFGSHLHSLLAEKYENADSLAMEVYKRQHEFNSFERLIEAVYERTLDELTTEFHHHLRTKYLGQYEGSIPPLNMTSTRLEPGLLGASVVQVYERSDSLFAMYYTGYDGRATLYNLPLVLSDTTTAQQEADSSSAVDWLKNEAQWEEDLWNSEIKTVLLRGDKAGLESFDPAVSVYNGERLAVSVKDRQSDVLVIMELVTGRELSRHEFTGFTLIRSPSWSPDGEKVVFSATTYDPDSDDSGPFDIFEYILSTGELRTLTNDTYYDTDPTYSPDGTKVVFTSDRGEGGDLGYTNIFVLNLLSGEIQYVTRGPWRDNSPSWTSSGDIVFSSDRSGNHDIYRCSFRGNCIRLTKYFGNVRMPMWVPGREAVVFNGSTERTTGVYIQEIPTSNLQDNPETFVVSESEREWIKTWDWNKASGTVEPYKTKLTTVNIVGYGESTPGYGESLGVGALFSDLFENHIFGISAGYNGYSYIQGHTNACASATYLNKVNRVNWGVSGHYCRGLELDAPRRNIYTHERKGATLFASRPSSLYERSELWMRAEQVDKKVLESWGYQTDFQHMPDSLDLTTSGFVMELGAARVRDNSLSYYSGPIGGSRWRIQGSISTNLSSLFSSESNNIFDRVGESNNTTAENKGSAIFNYTLLADYRKYLRIGLRSTYGIRAFAYYSGGQVPERITAGKMGGMAAFYPWLTPYGSKLWMINQRVSAPLVDNVSVGFLRFPSVQLSVFADFAQVWLEDNSRRGPIWGDMGIGFRVPVPATGLVIRLDYGKIFTLGQDFELLDRFRGKQFGWWIGYEF